MDYGGPKQWRHEFGIITEEGPKTVPITGACPVLSQKNFEKAKLMKSEGFMPENQRLTNPIVLWYWAEYTLSKGACNE